MKRRKPFRIKAMKLSEKWLAFRGSNPKTPRFERGGSANSPKGHLGLVRVGGLKPPTDRLLKRAQHLPFCHARIGEDGRTRTSTLTAALLFLKMRAFSFGESAGAHHTAGDRPYRFRDPRFGITSTRRNGTLIDLGVRGPAHARVSASAPAFAACVSPS
jgi:hypothetical protein